MTQPSSVTHPSNVLEILSAERIDDLWNAYSRDAMLAGARGSLVGSFPGAGPMAEALLGRYFETEDNLTYANRERVVIGLLTMARANVELGIHVYWGLMEGLSVAEMADIMVLTGSYQGISQYNNAIGVMKTVLGVLADQPPAKLDSGSCVGAIAGALG